MTTSSSVRPPAEPRGGDDDGSVSRTGGGVCPVDDADDDIDVWPEVAAELDHQARMRQAREGDELFNEVFEEELDSGEVVVPGEEDAGNDHPGAGAEGQDDGGERGQAARGRRIPRDANASTIRRT